jgi:hypothetical protein
MGILREIINNTVRITSPMAFRIGNRGANLSTTALILKSEHKTYLSVESLTRGCA